MNPLEIFQSMHIGWLIVAFIPIVLTVLSFRFNQRRKRVPEQKRIERLKSVRVFHQGDDPVAERTEFHLRR